MIKKRQEQRRVEVQQRNRAWCSVQSLCGKSQEQPQRIAIGCNRLATDGAVLATMLEKEAWTRLERDGALRSDMGVLPEGEAFETRSGDSHQIGDASHVPIGV